MAQDLANAIAATPPPCDRQPLPRTKAESLTDSSHGDVIATTQPHNGHIRQSTTSEQQSEIEDQSYTSQSYKKSDPLSRKCCYVVAQVLSQHTRREVSSDEIEAIAIEGDAIWVRLTNGWDAPIYIHTFRSIRRQQLEKQARVEVEMDLAVVLRESNTEDSSEHCGSSSEHLSLGSEHLTASSEHLEFSFQGEDSSYPDRSLTYPDYDQSYPDYDQSYPDRDIEVDSDDTPVNPKYRVWLSWHFLGSFHQSPVDDRWITNPTYGRDYQRHTTSDEAVCAIVAAWNTARQLRNSDQAVSL